MSEELPGRLLVATKPMDYERNMSFGFFVNTDNVGIGFYCMDDHRHTSFFGQRKVPGENIVLKVDWCFDASVEAGFAHCDHFFMAHCLFKQ